MIVEVLVKPGSSKGPLVEAVPFGGPGGGAAGGSGGGAAGGSISGAAGGSDDSAAGETGGGSDDSAAGATGSLVVYVREKAHDGEANEAVRRVLAKYFGVAKSCVSLVGGGKSRRKKFEIIG